MHLFVSTQQAFDDSAASAVLVVSIVATVCSSVINGAGIGPDQGGQHTPFSAPVLSRR